jgi:phosphoribosyl 1,2-cyclic phosphate phosphodiesterase
VKVTVLGCGSSGGTPLVGATGWGVCDPTEPRNRRLRPSILVEKGATTVLVDTSPDLRQQMIAAGVLDIDAVIYTHAHADHVHGIDDIRSFNFRHGGAIDAWGSAATLATLAARFAYVFEPYTEERPRFYRPCLTPRVIDGPFTIGDLEIIPFVQEHGRMPSLGFRFGRFAYSTDAHAFDEAAYATLAGIEAWVVDCLSETPHPTHSHLDQTLEWIARVSPQRAWLTHLGHNMDYATLVAKCPPGVAPAHDGLVIELAD